MVHTFNFRGRPLGSQSRSQKQDCPPPTIFNIIVTEESILLNPLEVFMFWIAGYTYVAEIGEINIQCYSCWLVASVFTGSQRSSFESIPNVLPCFCSAALCVDLSMTSTSFLLAWCHSYFVLLWGKMFIISQLVWLLSSLPQLVAWNQIHCCHLKSMAPPLYRLYCRQTWNW